MKQKITKMLIAFLLICGISTSRQIVTDCSVTPIETSSLKASADVVPDSLDDEQLVIVPGNFMIAQ